MTHPLIQSLSRPPVLLGVMAVVGLVIAGVAAVGAFAGGDAPEARRSGPAMAITIVAPVEPAIEPGAAMEVGPLRDGFDRAVLDRATLARAAMIADETWSPPEAWADHDGGHDDVPRMPKPSPAAEDPTPMQAYRAVAQDSRRPDPLNDGSRAFGFDRPRPDFAAERAARWAARDARAAAAAAVAVAGPPAGSGSGPVPYTEIVKYSSE